MRWGRRPGLVPGWEDIAGRTLADWSLLSTDDRDHLGYDADELLRTKRWEAARGFTLTEEMRTELAVQAVLLVLGLDLDQFREVSSIVVHPSTILRRGVRPGPVPGVVTDSPRALLGEASHRRGPVLLAWDAARRDARRPGRGQNVVFHEFAHKLDMLDDVVDGTPPLARAVDRDRWVEVCSAVYERVRRGEDSLLRPYAGSDPGEFFAVATESFFDRPEATAAEEPDLYAVLRDYFRQDPAARRVGAG